MIRRINVHITWTLAVVAIWSLSRVCSAFVTSNNFVRRGRSRELNKTSSTLSVEAESSMEENMFDKIVLARSSCTRFRRHGDEGGTGTGTNSDPSVVKACLELLDLARRAPSGFNAQPYKVVLVSTPEAKEKLAKYCIGRNADRVRDSDCTAVFLADKECGRDGARFGAFIRDTYKQRKASRAKTLNDEPEVSNSGNEESVPTLSKFAEWKVRILVMLFSSGYPLPRVISSPISFCVRLGVATVSAFTRRKILVPSLSGAETWATKNTSLVAMTYMLGASSRGLASCPMEGFNAGGMRKMLRIPRRYSICLIVSTGKPYVRVDDIKEDDVGMSHGVENGKSTTSRYPSEQVIFENYFSR